MNVALTLVSNYFYVYFSLTLILQNTWIPQLKIINGILLRITNIDWWVSIVPFDVCLLTVSFVSWSSFCSNYTKIQIVRARDFCILTFNCWLRSEIFLFLAAMSSSFTVISLHFALISSCSSFICLFLTCMKLAVWPTMPLLLIFALFSWIACKC